VCDEGKVEETGGEGTDITSNPTNIRTYFFMLVLQPLIRPSPIFQFPTHIHSR
jgi:hypothetical protein